MEPLAFGRSGKIIVDIALTAEMSPMMIADVSVDRVLRVVEADVIDEAFS